ncbi:cell envelope integrity protein TolA [Pseudomonas aeruginosa]
MQATLYQLKSKSQATTQTNQKIAGEAKKTASKQYEVEQLEQKKLEQQKLEQQKLEQQQVAAAKAAEQKKADEARKAEAQKAAEAKKADEAKKAAEAKAAEQKKQADIAKKRAEDEAKKRPLRTPRKGSRGREEESGRGGQEEGCCGSGEEESRRRGRQEKAAAAAAAARKAAEDKKAQALAELLSDTTERQQALADEVGSEVTGSLDDLIVNLVSQQWRRPPSARNGMSVEVLIEMLPDGTITNASVSRSSGDKPFDSSAVAAVRNVGRIPEMQQLPRATFDSLYRQRRIIFKPEDLSL